MRRFLLIAQVFLAGVAARAETPVEISFEFERAWEADRLVQLVRIPGGSVYFGALYTRPEETEVTECAARKWELIKQVDVSPEVFAEIERIFDSAKLRRAGEMEWGPICDGTSWRLKMQKGAFSIEIFAHDPERSPAGVPIVELGRMIADAVSANLFQKVNGPTSSQSTTPVERPDSNNSQPPGVAHH